MTTEQPENTDQKTDESITETIVTDAVKTTETTADSAEIDFSKVFPDGAFTTEEIQKHTEFFKTHNVSEDAAKAIIEDKLSSVQTAIQKAIDTQSEKIKADRAAELKAMAEKTQSIFGPELEKMKTLIPTGINKYLDREEADSFLKFCSESGMGNDHRLIRLLANIGKAASEDQPSTGDAPKPKQPRYPGSGLVVQ